MATGAELVAFSGGNPLHFNAERTAVLARRLRQELKVAVESVLSCPPEKVWDEVQRSALLLEVTRPLVRIVPAEGLQFPERWQERATVRCKCDLFGILPLGMRTIFLERIDSAAREIPSQ
jgi:hypothetical protein